MSYGICNLPLIPLRKEPSHRSELISQLLFGESFEILERKNDWLFVRIAHDGYQGWVEGQQQTGITEAVFNSLRDEPQALTDLSAHAICMKLGYDEMMHLLPGSTLRSEEHTSELQSLMRISYAVFCLKKKKHT